VFHWTESLAITRRTFVKSWGVWTPSYTAQSIILFYGYVTDCMTKSDGRTYIGKKNEPKDPDKSCIPWEDLDTKYKILTYKGNEFPDGSAGAAANYCRNPKHALFKLGRSALLISGVWCVTKVLKSGSTSRLPYEHLPCDVKLCGQCIRILHQV